MSVLDLLNNNQSSSDDQQQETTSTNNTSKPPLNQNREALVGPYDVLCGRDKLAFNNIGNRRMRVFVELRLQEYLDATSRHEKSYIIKTVADTVRNCGGRFLKWSDVEHRYLELSGKKVHEKCSHAFRDMVSSRQNNRGNPSSPKQFRSLSAPPLSQGQLDPQPPTLQSLNKDPKKNTSPRFAITSPMRIVKSFSSRDQRQGSTSTSTTQPKKNSPSFFEAQWGTLLSDQSVDCSSEWFEPRPIRPKASPRKEYAELTTNIPTAAELAQDDLFQEDESEEEQELVDLMQDTLFFE